MTNVMSGVELSRAYGTNLHSGRVYPAINRWAIFTPSLTGRISGDRAALIYKRGLLRGAGGLKLAGMSRMARIVIEGMF